MSAPKWTGPAPLVIASAIADGFTSRGFRAVCKPGLTYPGDVRVVVDGEDIAYVTAAGDVHVYVRQDSEGRPVVNGKLLQRSAA